MIKKTIAGAFLILLAGGIAAQPSISMQTILGSAAADTRVLLAQDYAAGVQNTDLRLPLLEQISLRTESDRFLLQRQEYLARVSFNGWREMNWQRHLRSATIDVAASSKKIAFHEALRERYEMIAEWFFTIRAIELQQQLLVLYADKEAVIQKTALYTGETDIDDLLRNQYDKDAANLQLRTLENRRDQIGQYLSTTGNASAASRLDTTGFIRPLQLDSILSALPLNPSFHPEILERNARTAQLSANYTLEKVQSRQMIDFVQMRYADDPQGGLNRDLAVGFGLTIPYKGSSKPKLGEIKIEQDALAMKTELLRLDLQQRVNNSRDQVHFLSTQYLAAQKLMQESTAWLTPDRMAILQQEGPLPLLKFQELQLKRAINLLDLEREMTQDYLDALYWSGQLSTPPLQNFLSSVLSPF